MHCYSLAVLTILLMVVTSSPLIPHDTQQFITMSATTPVSWNPGRRQTHFGPQRTMIAKQYPDGVLRTKSTEIEIVIESAAAESTVFPRSASDIQNAVEVKNEKRQVSTQDSDGTDETNLLGPLPPLLSVTWPLPKEHQTTTPSPTLVSGCTTTVMGDLHNPCVRSPEWTSTVTEYTAVDCHGCTSVHVLQPKWHCPVVLTTVGPLTASGPSTLTSTICASTLAL